jgi:transcriptional regulator with XRE-family HTH domain
MFSIATLFLTPADRELLTAALAGVAIVEPCAQVSELAHLVAAGRVDAVVAALRDDACANPVPAILALQKQDSTRPVILSVALTPTGARRVVKAVEAGLRATLVLRGYDDLGKAVRRAVAQLPHGSPEAEILQTTAPVATPAVRPFLTFAAIRAIHPITVREAAGAVGISVRTLERRLADKRLPRPARLLGWCRVLHVAWHLDILARPAKQVAGELRFPSLPALYNLLHDYTGLTPAVLPERGGFPTLLRRFGSALGDEDASDYKNASGVGA